jgi:N-acetyl-anhydromuramyl-L-alanine amidase AmpD
VRPIDFIVLHTAAAYDYKNRVVVHQPMCVIDAYHREHNGWLKIGYHWYVEEDGLGQRGREDHEIGAHVGGFNLGSLGLCVSGHGDFQPWNDAQIDEVIRKCAAWCRTYRVPVENVIGHREAPAHGAPPVHKTCPGVLVELDDIRARLAKRLQESG